MAKNNPYASKKMRILTMFGLVWLLLAVLWLGWVISAHALEHESFSLENGMEVVIVPDHRTPVVVHSVWYKAGAADEPVGKTGIAHMLEHMMFKGTDNIPAGEFSKIIARNGGKDNAFTSKDYTAYYQKISRDKLELVMQMEADRMVNLNISNETFQSERDVVLEERRLRVENKPIQRFFEKLNAVHYGDHAYAHPVIGWREDIENYALADALGWYKSNYGPNNATLVLVGDVTRVQAEPLVRKYYAPLAAREVNKNKIEPLPLSSKPLRFEKVDPEVQVPVFYRMYRAPSHFAGIANQPVDVNEVNALALMTQILGGNDTSLMYEVLVKELQLADSASASYNAVARGEETINLFVQPKPGVSLAEIEAALDTLIERFKTTPVALELVRARARFLADDVFTRDDPFTTAYRMGRWLMAGGAPGSFDEWQTQIKQVTPAGVQAVARKYLDINHSTSATLKGEAL